ncbi:MAG: DUF1040 family protein [Arsenophonus sp. NC-CH8-MAG3]
MFRIKFSLIITKLADQGSFKWNLCDLTDDTLYHLKMRRFLPEVMIPGLKKLEKDFKITLLYACNIIKN